MTRNYVFPERGPRATSRSTHRARTPLDRSPDGPTMSLVSDDENEGQHDFESDTEFEDDFEDVTEGVEHIEISDDEGGDEVHGRATAGLPIDLTEDDEDGLRDEEHFQREVSTASAETIGAGIPRGHQQLKSATTVFDARIQPGDTVECNDKSSDITAFLRIVFITRDNFGRIYLHGVLLKRHRDVDRKESFSKDYQGLLHSLLPNKKNEVCALLRVRHRSDITALDSHLEVRQIHEVGLVRSLTFTNKLRQDLSGRTRGEMYTKSQWQEAEQMGDLFCRWKYIEEVDIGKKKVVAFQIRAIEQHESDLGAGIAAERKFEIHRGSPPANLPSTNPPAKKRSRDTEVISIDSDSDTSADEYQRRNKSFAAKTTVERTKTVRHVTKSTVTRDDGSKEQRIKVKEQVTSIRTPGRQKKYTYGDLCSGAGGTAAGARKAGLQINYLIDLWSDACKTMKLNFNNTAVFKMDISSFATSASTIIDVVDILHISFPCQGHSLLNHQTNPEQDARNISTAYGTFGLILRKCKPRIVTLEQVSGIMYRSDGQHLREQIFTLVEAGYSVRWSLLSFADYELVQARPRVIVIAACPGQVLPPFPKPTHGSGPGLKKPTTIADVLAQVTRPRSHDIMSHAVPRNLPAHDPNMPLRGCITGGGVSKKSGNGYHPSGRRDFNLQEMAQMQGFSADHKFYGGVTSIRKQIGNAYPSLVAEKVFRGIIPALEETDEKMKAWSKVIEL